MMRIGILLLLLLSLFGVSAAQQCGAGSAIVCQGTKMLPAPQVKASIDVRDTAGVDCTGATDSSRALNTLFSHISYTRVIIPNGCQLKVVAAGLLINGQTNFLIEGNNYHGVAPAGSSIGGCNGSATGAVLTINRSAHWELKNFEINALLSISGCTSTNFTKNVVFTNAGSGGYAPTYARLEGMGLATSAGGASITNWVGFAVTGSPNLEQVTLEDNLIVGSNSPNSYCVWQNGGNSDDFLVEKNRIQNCFQGIRADADSLTAIHNHLSGNGNYSIFGANGASIYIGNLIAPVNLKYNSMTDGGPFLNTGNNCATATPLAPTIVEGNYIGTTDVSASEYTIGGGCGGATTVTGNHITNTSSPTPKAIVGNSNIASPNGAAGKLIADGNYLDSTLTYVPFTDPIPWQYGEFLPDLGLNTFDQTYGYRNSAYGTNGAARSAKLTFQTSTDNGPDNFSLVNVPNGTTGQSSTLVLDHNAGNTSANTYLALQPQIAGGLNVAAIANPSISGATDFVLVSGTSGSTSYSYKVVGISGGGCNTAASSALTVGNGNATLNSSHYNALYYIPDPGVIYYNVYRTASGGTPSTTGLIGTFYSSATPQAIQGSPNFADTGLAGDGSTPPATNTCAGDITVNGVKANNVTTSNSLGARTGAGSKDGGNVTAAGHLNQNATGNWAGTCAMSSGTSCTITLSAAYTSKPGCVVTAQGSSPIAGACSVSGTTVTITAASSNSATWAAMLFGNPN